MHVCVLCVYILLSRRVTKNAQQTAGPQGTGPDRGWGQRAQEGEGAVYHFGSGATRGDRAVVRLYVDMYVYVGLTVEAKTPTLTHTPCLSHSIIRHVAQLCWHMLCLGPDCRSAIFVSCSATKAHRFLRICTYIYVHPFIHATDTNTPNPIFKNNNKKTGRGPPPTPSGRGIPGPDAPVAPPLRQPLRARHRRGGAMDVDIHACECLCVHLIYSSHAHTHNPIRSDLSHPPP